MSEVMGEVMLILALIIGILFWIVLLYGLYICRKANRLLEELSEKNFFEEVADDD